MNLVEEFGLCFQRRRIACSDSKSVPCVLGLEAVLLAKSIHVVGILYVRIRGCRGTCLFGEDHLHCMLCFKFDRDEKVSDFGFQGLRGWFSVYTEFRP